MIDLEIIHKRTGIFILLLNFVEKCSKTFGDVQLDWELVVNNTAE